MSNKNKNIDYSKLTKVEKLEYLPITPSEVRVCHGSYFSKFITKEYFKQTTLPDGDEQTLVIIEANNLYYREQVNNNSLFDKAHNNKVMNSPLYNKDYPYFHLMWECSNLEHPILYTGYVVVNGTRLLKEQAHKWITTDVPF